MNKILKHLSLNIVSAPYLILMPHNTKLEHLSNIMGIGIITKLDSLSFINSSINSAIWQYLANSDKIEYCISLEHMSSENNT